jgi:ribosomal protein L11 methyltransferase
MDKYWIEFSFPVPVNEIDLVSNLLYGIGCIGINVEERKLDTFVAPNPDENLPAAFMVKAYFEVDEKVSTHEEKIVAALQPVLPGFAAEAMQSTKVFQEDWAEGWKQHFTALRFGPRLVVKPTWEEWQKQPGEALVSLDPGMAFGTGSHETTRLCLQALADRFEQPPAPDTVLDVGTGSGILAIAAAALGANHVLGCEIDEESCRVARENVELNKVAGTVTVTDQLLETIDGAYDLVIANILAEENVRLAEQLVARLSADGVLILSGILKEKEQYVCAGFSPHGLSEPDVKYEGEWCCISYKVKSLR